MKDLDKNERGIKNMAIINSVEGQFGDWKSQTISIKKTNIAKSDQFYDVTISVSTPNPGNL